MTVRFDGDFKCAKYLFDSCKKETLKDISNVINDGLNTRQCGFNDSLLILSKMLNNKAFVNCLSNVTKDCLNL